MLKKYTGLSVGIMVLVVLLSGCGGQRYASGEGNMPVPTREAETPVEEADEITEEEREFLMNVFSYDKERIRQDLLYSYQRDLLMQYRYAKDYLYEKYPGYEFGIEGVSKRSWGLEYPQTKIYFHAENIPDDFYVYMCESEDGLICEDNFYVYLIAEDYEEYLYDQCRDSVPSLVGVNTVIWRTKGREYDEELTVEEIVNGNKPVSPATQLYLCGESVSEEEWEQIVETLEETIIEKGFYGSYAVYYVTDDPVYGFDPEEQYSDWMQRALYKYDFQNFEK